MAKVNFSARKDPLLRPRRTTKPQTKPSADKRVEPLTAAGRTRPAATAAPAAPRRSAKAPAVQKPAGVVSITPHEAGRPAEARTEAASEDRQPSAPQQHAEHSRRVARRVQTSISLPPDRWDALDDLAASAGITNGQLLIAILSSAIPDSPAAAFSAVEQLLLNSAPEDALHEERNYRLPLQLRTRLDRLATALGSAPRPPRSLLIHALVAAHAPTTGEQVRELITAQRIDALRASMNQSSAD